MNSRYKGIFFITLSALSFAFMNAFVRLSGDLPSVQKSFFRNLVAFFIALIMIIRSKDGFKIEKGNLKYMILRATFGTVGILCNFYAVDHLVLSDASMLNKMSPFFGTVTDRTVRRDLRRYCLCDGAYPWAERTERFFGCNLLLGILVCGYTAISASGFPSDERLADLNASRCGTCGCRRTVRNYGGLLSCTCERDIHL